MVNLKNIKIPKYNLAEELINAISHGLGVALGIVTLILTIIISAKHNNILGVISSIIYGTSMIIMYLVSCLYHSFSPKLKVKKIFRVIDHVDIYFFIAGSYTPFCLCLIGGLSGWIIFGINWTCALLGAFLNIADLEKYQALSTILYLIMGWMIIFSFGTIKNSLALPGLILLISGGILYTVGAILYGIGAKKKYFHSVFHFFVLAGSILHFLSIIIYVVWINDLTYLINLKML